MADSKGYYKILEVSERATHTEIKRSYRRLARKYHPDKNSSLQAEDLIKKINAAYEVLSDHHKRLQYDKTGISILDSPEQDTSVSGGDSGHAPESQFSSTEFRWNSDHKRKTPKQRTEAAQVPEEHYFGPSHLDTPKGRFHIIVEPSLCLAFGSCETLAPKVFVVEKNRRVNPKARVECETCESFDKIYAAAQTCPTKAIRIVDRFTGDQIFP